MSWIDDLKQFVPSGSLSKGLHCFRSGAVRIDAASADRVQATVRGGGLYTVVVFVDEQAVVVSCTCPHYDDGNLCKHIWAAVLTAESKGHLRSIGDIDEPFLETELEHSVDDGESGGNDEWDEDEDDENDASRPYRYRNEYRARQSVPKPSPVDLWKQHLSALRSAIPARSNAPAEGKRRILYVADAAQSLSSGGLVVHAAACRMKKDGEWSTPAFHESLIRNVSQLDPDDQKLLALLSGSTEVYNYYPSREPGSARTRHLLAAGAQEMLISMLCATERFSLKPASTTPASKDGQLLPLAWDGGEPWSFKIEVERNGAAAYIVKGLLVRDGGRMSLAEPVLLVPGLAFFADRVARFDAGQTFQWVSVLRKNGDLLVPAAARTDFMKEIAQFPVLPPMELPEELRIETLSFEGSPELTIRPLGWRAGRKLRGDAVFDYGGIKVPETEAAVAVHDPRSGRFFRRDLEAESAALERLPGLGFRRTSPWEGHRWELALSRLPAAVRTLVSEGWRVDAEGKLYRRSGGFSLSVTSGIDWFEVGGSADFEGQSVEAPQLLKAIARGEHTIRLGDGTYGLLPEDWLKRYRFVAAVGKSDGGHLRFERHQAGILDALLASEPEVTFDESFIRVRREMETFAGVQAAEAAGTFNGVLRDYQRDGLGWLHFLRRFGFGGCLADDMGLGKTVQVLALLDSIAPEGKHPTLVVVPRSLIFNWKQESARFTPRLRILDHTGPDRTQRWDEIRKHDIVLTTYGTLRRDAPLLKDIHFDTVILDEAQTIKNASTEAAKAARLLKADHRLALTGTPVENRLGDLWSLFEFLNPGLLGTASVFRAYTATSRNGSGEAPSAPAALPALPVDDSFRIVSKALRPFILRRTKEQVARELPAKTEQTIYCELEPEQRRLYNELRVHYRDALLGRIDKVGIEKSRMHILEALLRLRQAACHPGLIDKDRADEPSAKLDSLAAQLMELSEEGHKALVFSQFTSLLAILRKRLDKDQLVYEYLDGRTRDRQSRVNRFQEDPSCMLFLISLKAGGLGLNLTAAEYVFLLDPWWNPAVEAQAIDRSHRIGQSRHVFAYRLIARDTVEEKILELQKTKREIADAIITADNSVLANLSRANLELLLS
jgi:superfamily II DNA or RNA helicase